MAEIRRIFLVEGGSGPIQSFEFDEVRVDLRNAEVWKGQELQQLSAKEFLLLKYFIEHPGETLSRRELLRNVWGYEAMIPTRTVDVHVSWLRRKIEANPKKPKNLVTLHGLGYKFLP